jgi:hypothetical protein
MKFRCVSITPFAPPDVPDVKTIEATSSGLISVAATRARASPEACDGRSSNERTRC